MALFRLELIHSQLLKGASCVFLPSLEGVDPLSLYFLQRGLLSLSFRIPHALLDDCHCSVRVVLHRSSIGNNIAR